MGTPREEVFDRLCRLAAKILNVPLTIVSLVDDQRQFFKADYGLPHPFSETRTLPIDFSLCRYTMAGDSIISSNAALDPFLKLHPSTEPWGISALIVLPLITEDGHVLGTFCCIQSTPREWTDFDLEVMKELTTSIMTEINLRNKVKKLQQEQNLRETFVAAISHDLRTPLTVVRLTAQLLERKLSSHAEVVGATGKMLNSLERAEMLIQNLLDANLIKSGVKIPLQIADCEVHRILEKTLSDLTVLHGDRFVVDGEKCLSIQADPHSLQRIFENLISNAAKYSPSDTQVYIRYGMKEGAFFFSVKNDGKPIPKEELINIFEPFHRAMYAQIGNQKGWGLGLPLVKGLLESQGGKVCVSSDEVNGTCFIFEIPQ